MWLPPCKTQRADALNGNCCCSCRDCQAWVKWSSEGGWMSHLISCLLMLISCLFCCCRIFENSFPQICTFFPSTTQAATDVYTYVHFASPISFISHSAGFCCASIHASLSCEDEGLWASHVSYSLYTISLLAVPKCQACYPSNPTIFYPCWLAVFFFFGYWFWHFRAT